VAKKALPQKRVETKIKSISFRSCVSIASYQTVHIEASADVTPGQTTKQVLDDLKEFVKTELRLAKDGRRVPIDGRFRV